MTVVSGNELSLPKNVMPELFHDSADGQVAFEYIYIFFLEQMKAPFKTASYVDLIYIFF